MLPLLSKFFGKKKAQPEAPSVRALVERCKQSHMDALSLYTYAAQIPTDGMSETEQQKFKSFWEAMTIIVNQNYNIEQYAETLRLWEKEKAREFLATIPSKRTVLGRDLSPAHHKDVEDMEAIENAIKALRGGK